MEGNCSFISYTTLEIFDCLFVSSDPAVYYLDIFIDNHVIRFWRFYLVALTALRIAAKIEEKDFTIAKAEALISCK